MRPFILELNVQMVQIIATQDGQDLRALSCEKTRTLQYIDSLWLHDSELVQGTKENR